MRSPGGILICTDVTGAAREADTFTCAHCNAVVIVKPMTDPAEMGGRCRMCDGLICKRCAARGVCDPFEERLKRIEASYHARRSYAA